MKMGIHSKLNFPVVDKSAIDHFFMAEVDGKDVIVNEGLVSWEPCTSNLWLGDHSS